MGGPSAHISGLTHLHVPESSNMYVYVHHLHDRHRDGMRLRERMKALFEAYNGPERGLLLAPLDLLLLYDKDRRA